MLRGTLADIAAQVSEAGIRRTAVIVVGPALTAGHSRTATSTPPTAAAAVRVLVLGGTTEGRALASACAAVPGIEVISSLAGRTRSPLLSGG